ncbi:hypothetical protein [Haloglycomyces albus]|uniref:hypothetical protein n=1 Tax=Haloglycomyces albus TaxID=526067 RepID=UPI0012EB2DD0|nr:hypothetical protein [Haloglycomyces albus]
MSDRDLPEEFRDTLPLEERDSSGNPPVDQPSVMGDEADAQSGSVGNAWVLLGLFLLIGIGVVMLIVFASSGDASESMLL